jgi:drug/metabolite transporter (DMT)-like permease
VYTARGRRGTDPLSTTADNFVRSVPFAAAFVLVPLEVAPGLEGAGLAAASGAVASGLAYALWYAALPALGMTRAAVVQLSVPAIAAAGAVVLLGEELALRTVIAGALILAGIALVTIRPR